MNFSKPIISIVFITYFAGIILPIFFQYSFEVSNNDTNKFLNNLVELNNSQLFFRIVKNNLSVVALNIIGAMTFGALTFIITFYNGFILSLVISNILKNYSYGFVISNFAPHSIELFAILTSCYLGYYLSSSFFNFCFSKNKKVDLSYKKVFYLSSVSIVITIVAAILEVYVTIR